MNASPAKYAVVRPSAGIVSRHRTMRAATAALKRQERGARAQGGFSLDYIQMWDKARGGYRDMVAGVDYDPDCDINGDWA